MSMFLPIAAVLALQVWLSMTDRFDSEVARAAAVVPSFLVLCILGGDETTVTEPQLGAAEPPQQGSWWDSAWGGDDAGGAPQPLSAARAPSVGARAGREGVGAWQFAGFALSWSWEPARQLGNRLWVAALSAWGWLLAAWPTSFNREHAVLLAALALWYAWRVHARRLAPTLLREALEELIAQDEEVRRAAGECARESERSYPSPSRGLFRRGSPSPEQRVEANPRKMHMHCAEGCENCLLRAAEAPEGRWPMTRAESREQLTAAALRYRQAERQLVRLCRRLNSFSQIGLDRWPSGRRRMAEVAQDCAVICMRAKSFDAASSEGGLSERSAEMLRRLIRENDSRLRAMWEAMDSDGDGRLTELEIRSHNSQVRPVGMRRYRHHSDEEGAEGPQDWLLGVVWVVLLTLTPGDEFSQAPYACRALSEQYELPAEWFRRLVDIRRDQMQDAALQAADERWPRLLRRAPRGTGWLLLCGVGAFFALPRLTGGLWRAACAWLWRWASATSLAFRLGLALLGCAAICEVLILLSDLTGLAPWTLLPAGLLPRRSIPGAFWRYKRRKECRAWCKRRFRKPPRPAFRVEEEGEVEEQEEEPAMDSSGRVIYKRFAVSTHPGWWRCVPADGAPAFYLRESTGQREWSLPAPDASDEEEDAMGWSPGRGGGPGTPPPSASYDMHVGVSGRAPRGKAWDKWLEATDSGGGDAALALDEAARLNQLPPSPLQLAEAEQSTRQWSRTATGAGGGDARPAGGRGGVPHNLVVKRLRKSNWERVRDAVSSPDPHSPARGGKAEAASPEEAERAELLKLAATARQVADDEWWGRDPVAPTNPLWKEPGGGRSLRHEEAEGLKQWRAAQTHGGSEAVGIGKSLEELPPPPWMMAKSEREFRATVEQQRDELVLKLATEQAARAAKERARLEKAARGDTGLLSPVRNLLS